MNREQRRASKRRVKKEKQQQSLADDVFGAKGTRTPQQIIQAKYGVRPERD